LQTEPKVEKVSLLITAPYEHGKDLEYELKQANAVIDAIDYSTNVTYTVTLPVAHQQQLMNQLTVRFGESIQWTSIA
jgi:putative IMPACT (imprinted ancient) family translation regulator